MRFFNKYIFISLIFILVFIVIATLLKSEVRSFAIYEANAKLDRVLTNQKALHGYIENHLKPVIYTLQGDGKLYQEFFDPKILSFTYIARNIYEIENQLYKDENKPSLYYKLAAKNPRNDLNKANEFEQKLIEMFNKDKNLTQYKGILENDNEKSLFFAKPVVPNKESCLRCHSDPELAPKELVAKYGNVKGFHEKVGDIRAVLSIKIPLSQGLKHASEYSNKLLLIIFISLLLVYIIIVYLLLRLEKKNEKLYEISTIDQLTNVYNRRVFDKDLQSSITKAIREKQSLILMMLDIDYFKKINDTYGHQVGDKILTEIADIMQNMTRDYDRVYRIGGEEFMIILNNIEKDKAILLGNRIRERIQKFYSGDKNITASLGVCQYNTEDDVTSFYRKVDDALYMAKENGRNLVYECQEK